MCSPLYINHNNFEDYLNARFTSSCVFDDIHFHTYNDSI